MNDYDQKIRQIIETTPSWEKDGGGVRGRTLAPLIEGASGPNLMGDPMPQQFNQQRSELLQQQDDPLPKLLLEGGGGGGGSCVGLALYTKTVGDPPNTTEQVWIDPATVAGELPSGFDPSDGQFIASGGSGNVWAEVNINQDTGRIVSVAVTGGASTPSDTNTAFYYTLGYYEYNEDAPTVTNYGCGSLDVVVCRNWFAGEAPFYGVTISR